MKHAVPLSLEELSAALAEATEQSVILAGGTDWVIQHRERRTEPDLIIYMGTIPGIDAAKLDGNHAYIGAMTPMVRIAAAFAGTPAFAALADAAGNIGSPQIRNKATIAGNLCTASPAGDLLPVAVLLDAQLRMINSAGMIVTMPASEFILGSKKTALHPQQAVISVDIELPAAETCVSAFCKIGSRKDVTISRESLGGLLRTDAQGTVSQARFVLGAVSDVPLRVPDAEALVIGRNIYELPAEALTEVFAAAVGANCRPCSRQYKSAAAKGLTADLLEILAKRFP